MVTNFKHLVTFIPLATGERGFRPPAAGDQPQHRVQDEHPGGAEGGHGQAAGPRPERRRRHEQGRRLKD